MTYRFRKKMLLGVFGNLFLCCWFCESVKSNGTGNVTDLIEPKNKSSNDILDNHETSIAMPDTELKQHNLEVPTDLKYLDNNFLNATYYTVENSKENEDNDAPSTTHDSTFQHLSFLSSFKAVQEVTEKLSNVDCVRDISYVLQAASRREKWALEMLDSFPKFPDGILYGNFYQLGNFDECLGVNKAVKIVTTNNSFFETTIKGQYCLADIHFKRKFEESKPETRRSDNMALQKNRTLFSNSVIHWAVCLPSTCSAKDAEILTNETFSSSLRDFEVTHIKVDPNKCESGKWLPITTGEIVYGVTVGVFLIFTILATVLHCWHLHQIRKSAVYNVDSLREKKSSPMREAIICFSLINTTERFFHTKSNDLNLESICGIKFISMVLIIAGHSLIFFVGGPVANTSFFLKVSTRVENTIFTNGPIIVDTFLLISGFLMCRLLLIEMDKRKGKINFLALYIARYIRLTPAYAVVLGLHATFLYRMGSGPFWEARIGLEKERCQKSWWINILYVNNYVGTDNLCMFQSWYLAVDYHLFILAAIVIYPLWKKPILGQAILVLCTLISVIVPLSITYADGLDPTFMGYPPEVGDLAKNFYFVNYYIKTHMRCSSYCIGLFYAYLVHIIHRDSIKIPTYVNILGWIFATICGTASMFSVVVFFEPDHTPNLIENAFYSAFHRVGWALSIGWILLVCITDNAVYVNKFLSHKFFIPASRLTYCAYLANGLVEIYSAGVTRQPMYMSIFELACKTLGHIGLTFALAFVLCIIFESPIHGMEKILLKSFDVKSQKTNKTQRLTVAEM